MCTYQGERFLERQLASIAAQSRLPDELVVRDDGSTDATVRLLEEFAAQAPFPVEVGVNPSRRGPCLNFEGAMAACSGDAVALCDQDDEWAPARLARLEEELEGPRRPGLVFSDATVIDSSSRPVGLTAWESVGFGARDVARVNGGHAFEVLSERQRAHGGTVTGATLAFRSELRDLVLPLPPWMAEPRPALLHDAWTALLAAAVGPVTAVEDRLVGYRRHDEQAAGLPASPRTLAPLPALVLGRAKLSSVVDRQSRQLQWSSAVLDRLRAAGGPAAGAAVADLEQRVEHLRARLGLPSGRLRRVPAVVREMATGRYRAYSSGIRSVARDLAR